MRANYQLITDSSVLRLGVKVVIRNRELDIRDAVFEDATSRLWQRQRTENQPLGCRGVLHKEMKKKV